MCKKLFILGTILLFFISSNTLCFFFGTDNIFLLIHPAFYCFSLGILLTKRKQLLLHKELIILLTTLIFILVFNFRTGREVDIKLYINSLFLPVLVSFYVLIFYKDNVRLKEYVSKIIIVFFLIECVWALSERLLNLNIIPFVTTNTTLAILQDLALFRSSALWGQALPNAIVVSIINSFILFSNGFSLKRKCQLFFLGILAILYFNARFALLVNALLFIVFVCNTLFNHSISKKEKRYIVFFLTVATLGIYVLIFNYSFGGRLVEMGLYDEGSADIRVRIFDIFLYSQISDFWFGIPASQLDLLRYRTATDLYIMENGWMILLFRFGIVFLVLLIVLYIPLFKRFVLNFTRKQATILLLFFMIMMSFNNAIATWDAFISVFFLCCYAFSNNKTIR